MMAFLGFILLKKYAETTATVFIILDGKCVRAQFQTSLVLEIKIVESVDEKD